MKKRGVTFLVAATAAICAQADTWTDPDAGYTWSYRINGDTAEIDNNYSPAISPSPESAVVVPSTLGGKPVASIGPYAFYGCTGLAGVTIPSSVADIGDSAFCGCSGLASVTIPSGVASIGDRAFDGCSGLASVTISSGVESIGEFAFSGCSGLASVTIPSGVESIGEFAFSGCSGLASVTIPSSVASIGYWAFYGCSGLKSVYVSLGDGDRVKGLVSSSGLDVNGVSFIESGAAVCRVTLGKNGGTGGDDYVTATEGKPMPTPRTAPTLSGFTFAGYWDTVKTDADGNPLGKQYYDANMKSVRNWDKKTATTLWAKWTNKVTFGKNGGTGGDDYVTVTKEQPMPERTAPTLSGWEFGGYWDTLAADANGNPLGKQYYDASMKSVRNWDKTAPGTLWAKWTVRVTLGKNGGTGGDNYVTAIRGQPFPKRTMPTKTGYTFGGYWISSSSKTGQCYNVDGTGTASMKWTTGGAPTIWALWTTTATCVEVPSPFAAPAVAEPTL